MSEIELKHTNLSSEEPTKPKTKKKLKIPSAITILLGVFIFSIVLTWVVHIINPDVKYDEVAEDWFNFNGSNWYVSSNGMYGIGDSIMAVIAGAFSASSLIFFMVAIGVIIQLLMETEVLKSLVNSLLKGMNNKKLLLLPTFFVLFALWGTILGSQEATLALMPIVVPALIVAGFDSTTGFLVILVGCTTGIAASVLEPFALGTLATEFDKQWQLAGNEGSIGIGTGILLRSALFVVYTTIGCLFVTWYGNRALKGKSVEEEERLKVNAENAKVSFGENDHKSLDKKQKIALSIVGITMLWMIFVLLPWTNWFPSLSDAAWWQTLSHIFFFNDETLIGGWNFYELGLLFVVGWFICAKVFNYTNRQMANNWKSAWKTFQGVAIILVLSRATSIVLTYSGNADYIANGAFGSLSSLQPLALSLIIFPIYLAMALFIPSMTGLAGISAPIIGPLVRTYSDPDVMLSAIIGIMAFYPLAQGLVNMISPTTGLVVAQAEVAGSNFGKTFPLLLSYGAVIAVAGIAIISLSFLI